MPVFSAIGRLRHNTPPLFSVLSAIVSAMAEVTYVYVFNYGNGAEFYSVI